MNQKTKPTQKAILSSKIAFYKAKMEQTKTALAIIDRDSMGYKALRKRLLQERIETYKAEMKKLDPENLENWMS